MFSDLFMSEYGMLKINRSFISALVLFAVTACTSSNSDDQIDLIVVGQTIVTMDANDTIIEDGAVAISDGVIVAIGKREDITGKYSARKTISGDDRVVLPGLINGHSHAAMTLLRGVADDLALMDWLNNYIFPAEVEFVDAEFVRVGTELACWEMIRGGTTTFVDMYYYGDVVADVVDRCGMRAMVSA
jgi:5-methylthioadenosine/S-adenosylhomocysteine deaminase